MEKQQGISYEKWAILPLAVKPKEVAQVSAKLPGNAVHCTGVAFTISDVCGCFSPGYMGDISLMFNNRQSHPLNFRVESRASRFRMDEVILKLEETLKSGGRLSGYYRNNLNIPYTLKIYLQCISKKEG